MFNQATTTKHTNACNWLASANLVPISHMAACGNRWIWTPEMGWLAMGFPVNQTRRVAAREHREVQPWKRNPPWTRTKSGSHRAKHKSVKKTRLRNSATWLKCEEEQEETISDHTLRGEPSQSGTQTKKGFRVQLDTNKSATPSPCHFSPLNTSHKNETHLQVQSVCPKRATGVPYSRNQICTRHRETKGPLSGFLQLPPKKPSTNFHLLKSPGKENKPSCRCPSKPPVDTPKHGEGKKTKPTPNRALASAPGSAWGSRACPPPRSRGLQSGPAAPAAAPSSSRSASRRRRSGAAACRGTLPRPQTQPDPKMGVLGLVSKPRKGDKAGVFFFAGAGETSGHDATVRAQNLEWKSLGLKKSGCSALLFLMAWSFMAERELQYREQLSYPIQQRSLALNWTLGAAPAAYGRRPRRGARHNV